jgi:diacylglycerol kinase (ATP)
MLKTLANLPKRVTSAMGYSLSGLGQAFKKEESVKLETLSLIVLAVVLFFVPWPVWKKIALVAAYLLIPLTELVNSALEDICDLVSPDFHPNIKAAKDKGSAAVLVAIIIGIVFLAALIVMPDA